jgi:hypothetical protein
MSYLFGNVGKDGAFEGEEWDAVCISGISMKMTFFLEKTLILYDVGIARVAAINARIPTS